MLTARLLDLVATLQADADDGAAKAKDYSYRANSAYFDGKAAALYFAARELRAAIGVEDIDIHPAREPDEPAIPLCHDEPWVEERRPEHGAAWRHGDKYTFTVECKAGRGSGNVGDDDQRYTLDELRRWAAL